jgi:hypothetical protein
MYFLHLRWHAMVTKDLLDTNIKYYLNHTTGHSPASKAKKAYRTTRNAVTTVCMPVQAVRTHWMSLRLLSPYYAFQFEITFLCYDWIWYQPHTNTAKQIVRTEIILNVDYDTYGLRHYVQMNQHKAMILVLFAWILTAKPRSKILTWPHI